MKIRDVLHRQMLNNGARVIPVPNNMRPTKESLSRLENEIHAQRDRNALMRYHSFQRAK